MAGRVRLAQVPPVRMTETGAPLTNACGGHATYEPADGPAHELSPLSAVEPGLLHGRHHPRHPPGALLAQGGTRGVQRRQQRREAQRRAVPRLQDRVEGARHKGVDRVYGVPGGVSGCEGGQGAGGHVPHGGVPVGELGVEEVGGEGPVVRVEGGDRGGDGEVGVGTGGQGEKVRRRDDRDAVGEVAEAAHALLEGGGGGAAADDLPVKARHGELRGQERDG